MTAQLPDSHILPPHRPLIEVPIVDKAKADKSLSVPRIAIPPSGKTSEMASAAFISHVVSPSPNEEALEKWCNDLLKLCPLYTLQDEFNGEARNLPDPRHLMRLFQSNPEKLDWVATDGLTAIQFLVKNRPTYVLAIIVEVLLDSKKKSIFPEKFLAQIKEEDRISIAHLMTDQATWQSVRWTESISSWEMDGPRLREFEGPSLAMSCIKYMGITSQPALEKLAEVHAQKKGYIFSELVGAYGITSQSALVKLAKIAAQQNGEGVSAYIGNYGIKNPLSLVEIAHLAAACPRDSSCFFSKYIGNYAIESESILIELAEKAAKVDGELTSEFIRNYNIKDPVSLIRIAKIAAESCGGNVAKYIDNYGIEDPSVLAEIAEIALSNSSFIELNNFSENIGNFGFEDPAVRIRMAKIVAEMEEGNISANIRNYEIEEPLALLEIAKIAAATAGWSRVSEHIGNYGITSQAELVEIAKIDAKQNGEIVSKYIGNYGITSQAELVEIAKIAAKQDGENTSKYIGNYGITSQTELVEIAKIAVQSSGLSTLDHLKEYGIKDQNSLLEIVALGLVHTPVLKLETCIAYIKKICGTDFDMPSLSKFRSYLKGTWEEVAKTPDPSLRARSTEWVESQQLRYACLVHIYVEKKKIEALRKGETPTVESLEKVVEETLQKQDEIFLQFIHIGSLEERTAWANKLFGFFAKPEIGDLFKELGTVSPYHLPVALACASSQDAGAMLSFAWQVKKISRLNEGPTMRQLAVTLLNLSNANLTPDQKKNILVNQLVEHGEDIHRLLKKLPSRQTDERAVKTIEQKMHIQKIKQESAVLVREFMAVKNGASKDKEKVPYPIKEAEIIKLANTDNSSEIKETILNKLFFKEQRIMERVRLINTLINLDKGAEIAESRSFSLAELRAILQQQIVGIFGLAKEDFATKEDFCNLWSTHIETPLKERYPEALFVYAGKINSLPQPAKGKMKIAFAQFVTAFAKGPQALRNLRAESPHFKGIEALLREPSEDKQAIEKWESFKKQWEDFPPLKSLSACLPAEKTEEKPFSWQFQQLLQTTLVTDKHVANWEKTFPLLQRYLAGVDASALLKESTEGRVSAPEEELDRICLRLCTAKTAMEMEGLLAELQSGLKQMYKLEGGRWEQWSRDIEGFAKTLREAKLRLPKENAYAKWKIGITRDPVDMLLLAKETAGCQSIDGTPALNKCALAYVIDHKNSAVVIRDEQGKIKARAILRVLYDKANKTAVLFLERHYASVSDSSLSIALNNYAIEYAKQVGLPLTTTTAVSDSDDDQYDGTIAALGSNAPFEYSDAGGGITNGSFEVKRPYQMK